MRKLQKLENCSLNPQIKYLFTLFAIALATLAGCGGGGGSSSSATAPVAVSGNLSTTEDISASSALSASDADGDPLTYSIVTNGSKGTAVISNAASGAYTYTPNLNANGSDSFTFKANDGGRDSNTATISVSITPVEDSPVANAGTLTTNEDTAAAGTLDAIDGENDPLTYTIVSNGSLGTATLTNATTGAFTYTPNLNANGTDSFTFRANDGKTNSNTATETVTITPENDPPVAISGCGTTRQASTYVGTLGASDVESNGLLTYSLAGGGTGPFVTAKGGTVTITNATTGAFTYTPKSLASHGERGSDSFDFEVSDPDSAVDTATETVIVDKTIMPLGDSITQGTINGAYPVAADRVAYRKALYDLLKSAGYKFDFVGTLTDGSGVSNFDYNNEGHGGYTASEIAWGKITDGSEGVFAWLNANPSDIVLLHAGTNGLTPNGDIDVEAILDEIDRWENSANGYHVTVILALIIDQAPNNPDVTAFNNNLMAMADDRISNPANPAYPDDIIIVDQQIDAGINYVIGTGADYTIGGDMGSTLHPNINGYGKMAGVWLNPVESLLEKCP